MVLSVQDINDMSYTDFVSLLNEENRPSGGEDTVRKIVINSFLNASSDVLEVGCTNGFSSFEISRLIGCRVIGVDINKNSIDNCCAKLKGLKNFFPNLNFKVASAYELPFKDKTFDLVMTGNASSFMDNKDCAIKEYFRVTKDYGFVAMVPIWYKTHPSNEIVKKVSQIIGVDIVPRLKSDWMSYLKNIKHEIYYVKDKSFNFVSDKELEDYVNMFLQKENIKTLSNDIKEAIYTRWKKTLMVFRDNLKEAGYSIVLIRKRPESDFREHNLF